MRRTLDKFGGLAITAGASLAAGTLGVIAEAAELAAALARLEEARCYRLVARGVAGAASARGAEQRERGE